MVKPFFLGILLAQLGLGPSVWAQSSRANRFDGEAISDFRVRSQLKQVNQLYRVIESKGYFDLSAEEGKARLIELYGQGVSRLLVSGPRILDRLSDDVVREIWAKFGSRAQELGHSTALEKWSILNTADLDERERLEVLLGESSGRDTIHAFSRALAQADSIDSYFQDLKRGLSSRTDLPFLTPFPATLWCAAEIKHDRSDDCNYVALPFTLVIDFIITPFILVWDILLGIAWLFTPSDKSEYNYKEPEVSYGGG